MWTTETKDDKEILDELLAALPGDWSLWDRRITTDGLIAEITPFPKDSWRSLFHVPTARNSPRSIGDAPHYRHLKDDLAKDIIKVVQKAEKAIQPFLNDVEILNEDYFSSIVDGAKYHIRSNKSDRKRIEEGTQPTGQSAWGWDHGTPVVRHYLRVKINATDYEVLKEDFMQIASEKRNALVSVIFKEAQKGIIDQDKFKLVDKLFQELFFQKKSFYRSLSEYQAILDPVLSISPVRETPFLKYLRTLSTRPGQHFQIISHRGEGINFYEFGPGTDRDDVRNVDILKEFGVFWRTANNTYDLAIFPSLSAKEQKQLLAIRELIPRLPKTGKQRSAVLRVYNSLLGNGKLYQNEYQDDCKAMVRIMGRFGLSKYQSLFGKVPKPKPSVDKVVLDSTSSEKVDMLQEAINRTSGYNRDILSEYKALVESGKSLDSDQLKQIRAIFYRIGMKPQTNSFRKASLRSFAESIHNLEMRIARLEKTSAP